MQRIEGGQEVAIQIGCVMAALGTLALAGYLYYRYKRTHRYDVVVWKFQLWVELISINVIKICIKVVFI